MLIAHRGGQPENTLEAFEKCVRIRSHGIEFDVWQTSDGEFIVTHDAYLDGHQVSLQTLDEIRKLKPTIPTLKETLDVIEQTAIVTKNQIPLLNIEMKPFKIANQLSSWLYDYIVESQTYSVFDFVVTSFLHTEIEAFHTAFPEMRVGWIMACFPVNLVKTLQNHPYVSLIVLGRNAVCYEYIKKLRQDLKIQESAVEIWVYCSKGDNETDLDQLWECGVIAYISD